jgi:hypothetical protein
LVFNKGASENIVTSQVPAKMTLVGQPSRHPVGAKPDLDNVSFAGGRSVPIGGAGQTSSG